MPAQVERADKSRRLKVLFITSWYPTRESPVAGIFVREHAKAVRLYDDVVVLHCAASKSSLKGLWRLERESDEDLTEGIPTFRLWWRQSPVPRTTYPIYLWAVYRAYRAIISRGFRPEVIHAHLHGAGVPAVLIGRRQKVPVMVTEHSSAFPKKLLGAVDLLQARIAFGWAHAVLPVSRALLDGIQNCGITARFCIVPNVVDTDLFRPNFSKQRGGPKRLLIVCLLDAEDKKGLTYLLDALAQLRQKRDDWHLDIVGDGPGRQTYERLVEQFDLSERITFHGAKPKMEVAEYMRGADLLVVPSLFETFSVVAAEALASGTPVLATRCGGPEEFITEGLGMLVPRKDVEALAKGVDYMLDHLDRFDPGQISGYAIDRFGSESVGKKLHAIYYSCLAKNPKRYLNNT